MFSANQLFDIDKTLAGVYLSGVKHPWEVLPEIKSIILSLSLTLTDDYVHTDEFVWIHKSAKISPTAWIGPVCIIGEGTQVRHGAFIRGSVLIGKNCVVGNSTEIKNAILFDGVQVPHYNYVGDSILGYKSHLGAGAITSNVKSDKTLVRVKSSEEIIDTSLKKFGAILGDNVEVGCNSVLNPGTVIGRNSRIYPLSCVRGTVPENSIYKGKDDIVIMEG